MSDRKTIYQVFRGIVNDRIDLLGTFDLLIEAENLLHKYQIYADEMFMNAEEKKMEWILEGPLCWRKANFRVFIEEDILNPTWEEFLKREW